MSMLQGGKVLTILAIDQRVGAALVVVGALAIFGFMLVVSALGEIRGRRTALVPPSMRPAPSDEELERSVLERTLAWGALITIVIALWLPAYWLREPKRLAEKKHNFSEFSIEEGRKLFSGDPHNPEDPGFCARCHGPNGEGTIQPVSIEGGSATLAEPPLAYIYSRYKAAGRNEDEITQLIYDAVNRGRAGTPMPTWLIAFGGPMNSAQIDDLVAYIRSIQKVFPQDDFAPPERTGEQLFAANCAVCHGHIGRQAEDGTYPIMGTGMTDGGQIGGSLSETPGPNLTVAMKRLSISLLRSTIERGRLNTNRYSMPAWSALGHDAIDKLVQYILKIQKG